MFDKELHKEYIFCSYLAHLLSGDEVDIWDLGNKVKLEYYKLEDQHGNPIVGEGALIMAKQRNGAVGDVKFRYNESLTQIYDYNNANPF